MIKLGWMYDVTMDLISTAAFYQILAVWKPWWKGVVSSTASMQIRRPCFGRTSRERWQFEAQASIKH
jgi:hypothetical protein